MHLHLVAVAWAYVVLMMALAEAMSPQGTIVGALITLALYGVLPLGLVLYILGTPQRRRARRAAEAAESPERADAPPTEPPSASKGNGARDRLIRDMWRQHFAGSTPDQAARSIDRSASAYQANGWLRDRDRSTPPARLDGTAERFVFLALKTGRPFPGYARLRQILAC